MPSVIGAADYLVHRCSRFGPVTPLKLQKLLYYVKAWGTVVGVELVPGDFERWDYGPANPSVYNKFKKYGREPIPRQSNPNIPEDKKELIDFIGISYAQYDAITLSKMTHKEKPWRKTSPNEVISKEIMKKYYSKHPFARNIPFDMEDGPFYPVGSDSDYGFTLDMAEDEAERVTRYKSFSEYLENRQEAADEYDEWKEFIRA